MSSHEKFLREKVRSCNANNNDKFQDKHRANDPPTGLVVLPALADERAAFLTLFL